MSNAQRARPRRAPSIYFRRDANGIKVHPVTIDQWEAINRCDDPDVEFVDEKQADRYKCIICLAILNNPVSIGCNGGHLFCQICIARHVASQGNHPRCPSCRDPFSRREVRSDNFTKRIIGDLTVKCPNHKLCEKRNALIQQRALLNQAPRDNRRDRPRQQNQDRSRSRSRSRERNRNNEQKQNEPMCAWTGEYRNLQNHLSNCPFAIFKHDVCGIPMLRSELASHGPVCPWRYVRCNRCNIEHVHCERHWCPLEIVRCGFCEAHMRRKDQRNHWHTACPRFPLKCEFGCDQKVNREDMQQHMHDNMAQHLAMTKKKWEEKEEEAGDLRRKVEYLESNQQELEEQQDAMKEQFTSLQNVVIRLLRNQR